MADVMISYAHEERDKARHLADVLEKFDFDVWWDRNLYAGDDFTEIIESKIRQATVVIVMWSKNSVKSRWVQGEASLADELHKLVTIKVDDCDLPLSYRNLHSPEIFKSKEDLENLLDLLQRKRVEEGERVDDTVLKEKKKQALDLTMSGDFWKDYWTITKSGLKNPFAFSENRQLSKSFYRKHWKVLLIIFAVMIVLSAMMDQSGY